MSNRHARHRRPAPRLPLLPILVLLSWHALLPLLVMVPVCWATASSGNPSFQTSALWGGLSLVLFAISAAIVLGLGVLHFSRNRPPSWARRRRTPPAPSPLPPEVREPSSVSPAETPSAQRRDTARSPPNSPQKDRADSVLDGRLWNLLQEHLRAFPHQEQGGFVLGFRKDGQSYFTAVVFPHQVSANGVHCEFPSEDIDIIREVCDELEGREGVERLSVVTAWIHTHPHLGVFLSGTDRNTIKQWVGVDRNMRAVVVDLYADGFARQVGVFDGDGRQVGVATSDVRLPGDLCEDFGRAVRRAYERRKRRAPDLLLAVGQPHLAGIA
jgi:hypothetical protein